MELDMLEVACAKGCKKPSNQKKKMEDERSLYATYNLNKENRFLKSLLYILYIKYLTDTRYYGLMRISLSVAHGHYVIVSYARTLLSIVHNVERF